MRHVDIDTGSRIAAVQSGALLGNLVEAMIDAFVPNTGMALFTHTAGGCVSEAGETDTAFPHRNAETMLVIAGGWTNPENDGNMMAPGRNWFTALEPYTGGYYDNIEWEGDARIARNFGPSYTRLQAVRARHDAGNPFRMNSNTLPAATVAAG